MVRLLHRWMKGVMIAGGRRSIRVSVFGWGILSKEIHSGHAVNNDGQLGGQIIGM